MSFGQPASAQTRIDEFLSHVPAAAAAAAGPADFFELIQILNPAVDGFVDFVIRDGLAEADEHGSTSNAMRLLECKSLSNATGYCSRPRVGPIRVQ